MDGHACERTDPDRARVQPVHGRNYLVKPLIRIQYASYNRKNSFSVRGKADSRAAPKQQREAEFFLKVAYDMAYAGLRIAEHYRCLRQTPLLYDLHESFEFGNVHERTPLIGTVRGC
jgi:hypothetical protein